MRKLKHREKALFHIQRGAETAGVPDDPHVAENGRVALMQPPVGVGVLDDPVRRIVLLARCVGDAAPYGGVVTRSAYPRRGRPVIRIPP